jgi:hypothetical protein
MCPLCIGTAAWLASGGTSAVGGVTAWVLKRRKRRKITNNPTSAVS